MAHRFSVEGFERLTVKTLQPQNFRVCLQRLYSLFCHGTTLMSKLFCLWGQSNSPWWELNKCLKSTKKKQNMQKSRECGWVRAYACQSSAIVATEISLADHIADSNNTWVAKQCINNFVCIDSAYGLMVTKPV